MTLMYRDKAGIEISYATWRLAIKAMVSSGYLTTTIVSGGYDVLIEKIYLGTSGSLFGVVVTCTEDLTAFYGYEVTFQTEAEADADYTRVIAAVQADSSLFVPTAQESSYLVYTQDTLPTELVLGQSLGIVYVSDSAKGEFVYMTEDGDWVSATTGLFVGLTATDPLPLVYYADSNPVVISTTQDSTGRGIDKAFNTSLSLVGAEYANGWTSHSSGGGVNERISYDMGEIKNIFKMRIANYHSSGGGTSSGAKNIKVYISSDDGDYNTDFESNSINMQEINTSILDIHTAVNEEDWQILTLLRPFYSGRYIIIDITDDYGSSKMGLRAVEIG